MKTTTSLLLVCFSLLVACSMAQPQYQIDALMDFYNHNNGPYWKESTNWGEGLPCTGKWHGIVCDQNNQKIVSIILIENRLLYGSIPESFGQLSDLQKIDLSDNAIYGPIPQSFANLTSLTDLILRSGLIYGPFPDVLFSIPSLRNLDLSDGQHSGYLPDKFDSLPSLENLDLSSNELTGSVPSTILNNLSNCVINLDGNTFSWINWDQWTNSTALSNSTISISNNEISGSLSYQIYWPKQLMIKKNLLTGTLPKLKTSKSIPSITYFDASHNKLTGNLPVSLTKATNLSVINIEYNIGMMGQIPVEYASMPNLLTLQFEETYLSCPERNSQWDKFEEIASTSCLPVYYSSSSSSPHEHLGLYITLFVGGIVLLLAVVVGLVILFFVRYRRQRSSLSSSDLFSPVDLLDLS